MLILIAAFASCAYFNTWWMARREYREAIDGAGVDFTDPYAQTQLKGEPAKLVDSVIERCGKILLLHSESSLVDDALLTMGNCFVLKAEYEKAMRKYEELLELYALSDLVYEARYMQAYTLVREGKVDQATPILTELLAQTEDKEMRQQAAYLAGRIFHHEGDCESAIEHLTAYLDEFDDERLAGRARLNLASCMAKSDMAEEAIRILEPMAGGDDADQIAAAMGIGIAYRTLGDYNRSAEILNGIAETAFEDSVRARALIEVAGTYQDMEEFQSAIEALDTASEIAREKAPLMSTEATYAKGLLYEKQLVDYDKAIETFGTISKQKSDFALLAKDRHEALTSLQTYRKTMEDSIPDTPEQTAETLFMMAEILIEDLGLESDAREYLRSVADSIPQTDWGARAALRFAALLEAEGDTLARTYQRKVIELFPNTVYANVARSRLGLPLVDVVVEKPDTLAADSLAADSVAVDSTAAAGPGDGAVPDSLSGAAGSDRRVPPRSSSVSPDSAWAARRRSRPPGMTDGASSAKQHLRPPPVMPVVKDSTDADEQEPETEPEPGDSSGAGDSTGVTDPPETGGSPEIPVPGEETDLTPSSPADSSGSEDNPGDTSEDSEGRYQ
jgi:tetratricopeptide (TPR) repeat protein